MYTKVDSRPIIDSFSRTWFDAAAERKLLIQRCKDTGTYQYYPRNHSLKTLSENVEWVEATGKGKLHTYSILHRAGNEEFVDDCPYVLAIVELEEGPRLTSRIVDVPLDTIECDMPVQVVFRDIGDGTVMPYFTGV